MAAPAHSPSLSPTASATEDQDIDIASTMGFASFGAKPNPPKKKRKIRFPSTVSEGSGSNNTPLGMRGGKHGWPVPDLNAAQEGREQQAQGQLRGEKVEGGWKVWNVEGDNGEADALGRIDGLARAPEFEDKGPSYIVGDEEIRTSDGNTNSVMAPPMQLGKSNAEKGPGGLEPGRKTDGQWDWQALRKGVRDARGEMAFYDASFVEDPWKHLVNDRDDGGKQSGT